MSRENISLCFAIGGVGEMILGAYLSQFIKKEPTRKICAYAAIILGLTLFLIGFGMLPTTFG